MIRLSSFDRALTAVRGARSVSCLAYTIESRAMLRELEAASARGATVRVRLAGQPFNDSKGKLADRNAAEVAELRNAGVDAELVDPSATAMTIHGKALLADRSLYLDDMNWTAGGKDTILADTSAADARAVGDAMRGRLDAPTKSLAVRKSDAIASEAQLLRTAHSGDRVEVESESFGRANAVYYALASAAKRGAHVELLVSSRDLAGDTRERTALHDLKRVGARVRTCTESEKLAVVYHARAWVGSANATSSYFTPNQFDWGLRTDAHAIVSATSAKFEQRWQHDSHALR